MTEVYINSTHTLWSTSGVVHIEGIDLQGKEIYIEFDANQLLADIPHLYNQAKKARKLEDKRIKEQYNNLKKEL